MKISLTKYAQALSQSLKGEKDQKVIDEKIGNLLKVFVKNKQRKVIKNFPRVFRKIWMMQKGQVEVRLTLPYEPEDSEKSKLVKLLSGALDKEVILSLNVDKEVIGGMKIEMDDFIIDGTIQRSLEQLRTDLINSKS